MRKQAEKKLISFTNLPLIDRLVKDEAYIENRAESAIIENRLLNSFLPKNETARSIAEFHLYGELQENNIGSTLSAIFSMNAAGTKRAWGSKYENLLELVLFARSETVFCNTIPTGEEDPYHHFLSQLDSICHELEFLAEKADEKKGYYTKEASYARELLTEAKNEPHFMRYINFYQLVIDNWDDFKGLSITYRMLSDLAAMESGWRNTAETRVKLLSILRTISESWDE